MTENTDVRRVLLKNHQRVPYDLNALDSAENRTAAVLAPDCDGGPRLARDYEERWQQGNREVVSTH
jgi:hypothetical protein